LNLLFIIFFFLRLDLGLESDRVRVRSFRRVRASLHVVVLGRGARVASVLGSHEAVPAAVALRVRLVLLTGLVGLRHGGGVGHVLPARVS